MPSCSKPTMLAIVPYLVSPTAIFGFNLEIIATDDGIKADIKAWCEKTGNELIKIDETDGEYHTYVRKLAPDE